MYNILGSESYREYGTPACVTLEYYPPHCIGYGDDEIRYEDGFTIPCSRGGGFRSFLYFFQCSFMGTVPPIIIGTSYFLIYKKVVQTGNKLAKYGVGSLRISSQLNCHNQEQTIKETKLRTALFRKLLNRLESKGKGNKSQTTESSIQGSRAKKKEGKLFPSRAVMHKALAYTVSYFMACTPFFAYVLVVIVARKDYPPVLSYSSAFFIPLQGVFNLFIYLYPKVLSIKKKGIRKKQMWKNWVHL